MTTFTSGPVTVCGLSVAAQRRARPTADCRYAISIDGEAPQIVNITTATGATTPR